MKYRRLKAILRGRGYTCRQGKGSHSIWTHPTQPYARLVLAGANGSDVKAYQFARLQRHQQQAHKGTQPFKQSLANREVEF
jgi:predicted RNA binding protein YcfA (HicA-like mRNA interferase family)